MNMLVTHEREAEVDSYNLPKLTIEEMAIQDNGKKHTFKCWLKVCAQITSSFAADYFLALRYQIRYPDLIFPTLT